MCALYSGLGANAGQRTHDLTAAEAAGANIQMRRTAVHQHANALDIGGVHTTGLVFGMADAVAVHQTLVAHFTILAHFRYTSLSELSNPRGRAAESFF